MKKKYTLLSLFLLLLFTPLSSEETKGEEPTEERVETKHRIQLSGKEIAYTAIAGNLLLEGEDEKPEASLFYVSYTKDNEPDTHKRPLTFCFNGGPGSAAVWLHIGAFGPKKIAIDPNGYPLLACVLEENPHSLLDVTDLVFVDPVSTGYSRTIDPDSKKKFHGVEEDIKAMAAFIRLYIQKNQRWDSPKFVAGESYGTTRAAGVASVLHDDHHLDLNGIIFISTVLDYQTLRNDPGNDLPYTLFLPTYTATAWYHNRLQGELAADLDRAIEESTAFAQGDYLRLLFQGDALSDIERDAAAEKLASLTGVPAKVLIDSRLRLTPFQFMKEVLPEKPRFVGRFDSRYTATDQGELGEYTPFDPSVDSIAGPYNAAFNTYLQKSLKWEGRGEYQLLNPSVFPWDYGRAKNCYLNISTHLSQLMHKNPHLRLFAASGYYDLATPFFITEYTMNHLRLSPSLRNNIEIHGYPAGHMVYNDAPSHAQLKADLAAYYAKTLHP